MALDQVSIVVKGHFNAAIFSPAWLLSQKLIGASEYADAEVEIISREFALFRTGWLTCQVTPDTFQLSTTEPAEFERARDAAVGVLGALPHTPVAALGINREIHFAARDSDQYHAVGDLLAPKDFWESLMVLPGTRQVVIWGQRPDRFGGREQISVEPSFQFQGHIFISHNDHFTLRIDESKPKTRDEAWSADARQAASLKPSAEKIPIVKEILGTEWVASIKRSNDVMEKIARIQ